MTHKKLAGIFSTRKRLSDGTMRVYWYHRASGNRLPGDYGSPEFLTAYLDANRLAPKDRNGRADTNRTAPQDRSCTVHQPPNPP